MAGHFAGSRKSWKLILSSVSLVIIATLSFSMSLELNVKGPDGGLLGDFERFVCAAEGSDVSPNTSLMWKYKLRNGEMKDVLDADILSALAFQQNTTGKITISNLIRLSNSNIQEVVCQIASQEISASKAIEIRDLSPVDMNDDLCSQAENAGKPMIIIQTATMDFIPPYRKNHYLDGNAVMLKYPSETSQVQVTCISGDNENPMWSMKKDDASKMRFSAWAEMEIGQPKCKKQLLRIYSVYGEPGQTVTIGLQCHSGSAKSPSFDLRFEIDAITRMRDYNATQNCIEETVEQFYGKELTGVGVGSSVLIVLMMVGIAVMKKQLNNQQNINKQLIQGNGQENTMNPSPHGSNA